MGQHRHVQRHREDVQVGPPEVVVVMVVRVVMVVMMIVTPQHPGAHEVDPEADDCDRDGFIEADVDG